MRIISGIYKGRKLKSSTDLSIRPTTDRVKEYIFNILGDFPSNKIVVDMFAGSGNLGLEALSRGAKETIFIEKEISSIEILKENIKHLKLPEKKCKIVQSDAIDYAATTKIKIDLCLMDPPFIYPQLQELLNVLFSRTIFDKQSILVVEYEISNPIEMENHLYTIIKQKKFGRSLISFLEKKV